MYQKYQSIILKDAYLSELFQKMNEIYGNDGHDEELFNNLSLYLDKKCEFAYQLGNHPLALVYLHFITDIWGDVEILGSSSAELLNELYLQEKDYSRAIFYLNYAYSDGNNKERVKSKLEQLIKNHHIFGIDDERIKKQRIYSQKVHLLKFENHRKNKIMWDLFNPELHGNAENCQIEKQQKRLDRLDYIKDKVTSLPDLLGDHNAIIKLWVPEIILQCIAEENWKSISEATRDFLIEHCYDKMALKYLYEQKQKISIDAPSDQSLACIMPTYELYNLGKNLCGIKLCCHESLKTDLSVLATLENMRLSEYLRQILIIHYLGNGFIVDFEQQFKLTKRAEQKFNQISEDEF